MTTNIVMTLAWVVVTNSTLLYRETITRSYDGNVTWAVDMNPSYTVGVYKDVVSSNLVGTFVFGDKPHEVAVHEVVLLSRPFLFTERRTPVEYYGGINWIPANGLIESSNITLTVTTNPNVFLGATNALSAPLPMSSDITITVTATNKTSDLLRTNVFELK